MGRIQASIRSFNGFDISGGKVPTQPNIAAIHLNRRQAARCDLLGKREQD